MPRYRVSLQLFGPRGAIDNVGDDVEVHSPKRVGDLMVCVVDWANAEHAAVGAESLRKGLQFGSQVVSDARLPIDLDLGEVAYEAYFKACDGKSLITGAALPGYRDQKPEIQKAWLQAGIAVVRAAIPPETSDG